MTKLKSAKLGFLTVVAAGFLVMLGMFAMPATQTFGLETDVEESDSDDAGATTTTPATTAPSTTPANSGAALPPAAPVQSDAGAGATTLPSAGSGGYLDSGSQSALGFALVGLGIALVGSGTAVWAYGRKR
jgi:hypothetical protein